MTTSQRPYLRLVSTDQPETTLLSRDLAAAPRDARQPMLFSDASLHTLGFIKAGELDADKFVSLIREAKPQIIFDLRSIPSFASRTLSRKDAFALFEENGVKYYDVAGVLGISGGRDGLLNPALLINALQVNVLRHSRGLSGPVFFFINDELFHDDYFSAIAKQLPHQDPRSWEIACWPNEPTIKSRTDRELVFVSHANPEDNEVAMWFSSRLAASGYQVWSDVTRLIGGELFWDTIEDAIRDKAAKVVVLLSRDGHQKPGLLDEVNLAITTERSEKLSRFVIPILVDDLPFSAVRANLARRNIIDGHANLAGALSKLLSILKEDKVPAANANASSELFVGQPRPKLETEEWKVLVENKLSILGWPRVIRKFRASSSTALPFPAHPVKNGVVTFEDWDAVEAAFGAPPVKAGEAAFDLQESSGALALVFSDRSETQKAVSSIIRQAWDKKCQDRGFTRFQLANNSSCWFLSDGFQKANRVRYLDSSRTERQKILVGHSPRRRVFWHFALEARPSVTDASIRIVPHVVFSEDGKTPLSSHDRQLSLRRGFCRNWWNARWRDLLGASLSYLAEGAGTLALPVSRRTSIEVTARFKTHAVETAENQSNEALSSEVMRIEEPSIAVGHGQTSDYAKEGLLLFGPVPFERNPKHVRAGVIGTTKGIELFGTWAKEFNAFQADPAASRNAMPFPGFEAVFGAKWEPKPAHTIALSRTDLINSILLQDRHQAIFKSVGMYVDQIVKAVREDDVDVDIWFVVIPDEIFLYGRPASRVPSAVAIATPDAMGRAVARRFLSSAPSLFPEDNAEAAIYDLHLDFHHQLKARLLNVLAVTQIMRESSLAKLTAAAVAEPPTRPDTSQVSNQLDDLESELDDDLLEELVIDEANETDTNGIAEFDDRVSSKSEEIDLFGHNAAPSSYVAVNRQMQDKASVAWNLATAAFFKSGGRPWRVADPRAGVCYVGLIFKRDPSSKSRQSCCGAQMFLQDGDGLVFKGAMGPWYSEETRQFHLSRMEARRLVSALLESYAEQHPEPPRELFIHGRTRFNSEEWAGFCDAIDSAKTRLAGIRITRTNDYKLFSSGERAVRRGTALRLNRRTGLLWTTGFVERLGTYQGRETPNPLRVEIVNDTDRETDLSVVMRDIMMLTKMNFNSCVYSDGMPVTMRFADAIGDVLVTVKDQKVPPLPFRYYI